MERWIEQTALKPLIGMIIPAYFSATPSDEMVRDLLWMTLCDSHHYALWENVCVVVDGDPRTQRVALALQEHVRAEFGTTFRLLPLPENRGKLAVIKAGIESLMATADDVAYFVIRDGDGDHVASDMPQLVRAVARLEEAYGHSNVVVAGARSSRHRPMGWIRGELEAYLDAITLDALAYALARQGRALNLRHCSDEHVPDLSSGYKAYGREAARRLFVDDHVEYATITPDHYWHYGPETMTIVEGTLQGLVIAEVQRLTWDGQPASSFGDFRHISLYGELLSWVFGRLSIPVDVAAQMLDNRSPSLDLGTTEHGRTTLIELRQYVLEKLCDYQNRPREDIPAQRPVLPFL